jgi:triosephosphate isomerase
MFYFGSNFKMTQTPSASRAFVTGLAEKLPDVLATLPPVQPFVIPPFTSLAGLAEMCEPHIWLAAQNMHHELSGAFTGEISAPMLEELGVQMVMLGHAERRQVFGETDAYVQRKVTTALARGLRVLLCVGETAWEREHGVTASTLTRQLRIALHHVTAPQLTGDVPRLLVAYEPVWAIGEGSTVATPEAIAASIVSIREVLVETFAELNVPLLYGGSVNLENCRDYAALAGIDGLFVGRAAWTVEGYLEVLKAGVLARH